MPLPHWLLVVLALGFGVVANLDAQEQSGDGMASANPEAGAATREQPARFIISTGQGDQALAALRPDQATWLETETHGRVLALLERERSGPAKGAMVIVSDVGQTADTGLTGALREPLAKAGWAALSLGLPQPPEALLQWRESTGPSSSMPPSGAGMSDTKGAGRETDDAPETDASAQSSAVIDVMATEDVAQVRDAYRTQLSSYLAAAAQRLKDMGYSPLVFVGIGRGADVVTAHVLEQGGAGVVVWVAPELSGESLASLAGASAAPSVLDLVSTQNRGSGIAARRSRLRRENVANYQQQAVAMPVRPLARDARQIVNRISGWVRPERTSK